MEATLFCRAIFTRTPAPGIQLTWLLKRRAWLPLWRRQLPVPSLARAVQVVPLSIRCGTVLLRSQFRSESKSSSFHESHVRPCQNLVTTCDCRRDLFGRSNLRGRRLSLCITVCARFCGADSATGRPREAPHQGQLVRQFTGTACSTSRAVWPSYAKCGPCCGRSRSICRLCTSPQT